MVMSIGPEKYRNSSYDLESLHRELIEARNLAIKTDNLVKNLGAEIKQIARYQEAYQRKYLFNSAVAYVLFVIVIFSGLYLAFNAKITSAKREIDHYQARNAILEENLHEVEVELQQRREAETRAYAFFELLESGNPDEVVEQFNEIRMQLVDRTMIELLQDRVDEITYSLAEEAFRNGMTFIQNENWTDARDAFLRSLNHVERTPWTPELYYNLGEALFESEDFEGALHYFDLALTAEELDDSYRASARYRRGLCLENTGRLAEAVQAYSEFREYHPTHRFAGRALHYINRIQRQLDYSESE